VFVCFHFFHCFFTLHFPRQIIYPSRVVTPKITTTVALCLSHTARPKFQQAFLCIILVYTVALCRVPELYLFGCRAAIKILHEYFSSQHAEHRGVYTLCLALFSAWTEIITFGPPKLFEFLSHSGGKIDCLLHTTHNTRVMASHCYAPASPSPPLLPI
jgi:hypothetical protein